ncbi:hypothetical protein [uncultured Pseudoteredinibacter sp.]|uniref:hypothetical protein n=1 Tax=uncultured Pseudoteredinibacter sp. TaxID=1641701 RepID=UPI002635EAD1|nr:hypothetical protein [uncultured Pseudoteredinibacter sp.]
MDVWLIGIVTLIAMWVWISLLAILCLFLDPDLEPIQRWGQAGIVIILPFIGPAFVLMLVNEHSPEVVARFYIPWPFRMIVLNRQQRRGGQGSNGEEAPGIHSGGHGGDGGGGSD